MFAICCAWCLAVWICLHKMCMFSCPSPGVKRTFPHIPICGTEFPGVEQEAGAVLLVAFPGRPSPNRAPLVWAQHLVDGGTVLVSQGGRGRVTILLRIWREGGGKPQRRIMRKPSRKASGVVLSYIVDKLQEHTSTTTVTKFLGNVLEKPTQTLLQHYSLLNVHICLSVSISHNYIFGCSLLLRDSLPLNQK